MYVEKIGDLNIKAFGSGEQKRENVYLQSLYDLLIKILNHVMCRLKNRILLSMSLSCLEKEYLYNYY